MLQHNQDIVRVSTCSDLLDQYQSLHFFSCVLTATAALVLFFSMTVRVSLSIPVMLVFMILLGIGETVLAVRVGFDRNLLSRLATKTEITQDDLAALDESLSHFRLRSNREEVRPLDSRLEGSLRLFKRQAWLCGAQIALLLAAAGVHCMNMVVAGT